jgi:hypothetical protein
MSQNDRVLNVGASSRASDVQAIADYAAMADDRALEIVFTPGAAQKVIVPLSEESATINPSLLAVGKDTDGSLANGKVRVRPAHFIAGVSGDANSIQLAGKLDANLDSATFGNNSSGSTRYDLLYATISYGLTTTATVRQKPTSGSAPQSVTLTIEAEMQVVLGIAANAGSVTPLASLPADSGSGKASVFNFPVALVAIANGFSGGAINQSSIAPLWLRGGVKHSKLRNAWPISLFTAGIADTPTTQFTERFNGFHKTYGVVKHKTTTAIVGDSTIDWRKRIIRVSMVRPDPETGAYPEPTALTLYGANAALSGDSGWYYTGNGGSGSPPTGAWNFTPLNNAGSVGSWQWQIWADSTTGNLKFRCATAPTDGTNGDNWFIIIEYSDRFEGV